MVDMMVLQEGAVAAELEEPGIVGLKHLGSD